MSIEIFRQIHSVLPTPAEEIDVTATLRGTPEGVKIVVSKSVEPPAIARTIRYSHDVPSSDGPPIRQRSMHWYVKEVPVTVPETEAEPEQRTIEEKLVALNSTVRRSVENGRLLHDEPTFNPVPEIALMSLHRQVTQALDARVEPRPIA